MAIEKVRSQIRQYVRSEFLDEFEALCEDADGLWDELDGETDSSKAWDLALSWSTNILSLAKMERALLSEILPTMQAEIDAFIPETVALNQRLERANDLTYALRSGSVRQPQNIDQTAKLQVHREAKATKLRLVAELGKEGQVLAESKRPLKAAVGGIKSSIRILTAYIDARFSVMKPMSRFAPGVDLRQISGQSESDPHKRFADGWVAAMDPENRIEADKIRKFRARQTAMRLRPVHDFEKDEQETLAIRNRKKPSRFAKQIRHKVA